MHRQSAAGAPIPVAAAAACEHWCAATSSHTLHLMTNAPTLLLTRCRLGQVAIVVALALLAPPVDAHKRAMTMDAARARAAGKKNQGTCKIEAWEKREIAGCEKLFLHYAKLGDDGAVELAAALKDSAVTSLSLFGCGVGDRGAAALATVMEQSASAAPTSSSCYAMRVLVALVPLLTFRCASQRR